MSSSSSGSSLPQYRQSVEGAAAVVVAIEKVEDIKEGVACKDNEKEKYPISVKPYSLKPMLSYEHL